MANTFTQIHIQAVFAVQNRISLIGKDCKDELYKYITGLLQNQGHKVLQINGMPDHVHLLIGLRPTQALADLMQMVKQDSFKWINTKGFVKESFRGNPVMGLFLIQKIKYHE